STCKADSSAGPAIVKKPGSRNYTTHVTQDILLQVVRCIQALALYFNLGISKLAAFAIRKILSAYKTKTHEYRITRYIPECLLRLSAHLQYHRLIYHLSVQPSCASIQSVFTLHLVNDLRGAFDFCHWG